MADYRAIIGLMIRFLVYLCLDFDIVVLLMFRIPRYIRQEFEASPKALSHPQLESDSQLHLDPTKLI